MNNTILILVCIAIVTTVVSICTTMKMIDIRKKVNCIISNHNEIIHILEEENRLLQNRILTIPNEILSTIERVIDSNPDQTTNDVKTIIQSNIKSYSDKLNR